MRCRAAQHAGGVGGVCLQSARAVEATWNLRTAQGSNYELAALRSSAARALLVRGLCMHAGSCRERDAGLLPSWRAHAVPAVVGQWGGGAPFKRRVQKPLSTGSSRAVVEEHVHVAAAHADAEHLAARPLVTSSSALCTCSDGGPSGAEGLASWCACRELIRVRCASMLRLARLLAVIM